MIEILTCADWGARFVNNGGLKRRAAMSVTIHHTAGNNATPRWPAVLERTRCFKLARSIQKFHMEQNGWRDSGMHFLVTRGGLILESRHGSLKAAQQGLVIRGAHAGDDMANQTSFGLECEGTYISAVMPEAQRKALVNLCAHLCWWGDVQTQELHGHREFRRTACPGDALFALLPELRNEAHDRKLELINSA